MRHNFDLVTSNTNLPISLAYVTQISIPKLPDVKLFYFKLRNNALVSALCDSKASFYKLTFCDKRLLYISIHFVVNVETNRRISKSVLFKIKQKSLFKQFEMVINISQLN